MAPEPREVGPSTLCVHGPRRPGTGEPLVTPLVRSSVFVLDDEAYALRSAGRGDEARVYARETNPTVEALEARLAALEGAERALVLASGMAALSTLCLAVLASGDRVVASRHLYGGSTALFRHLLPRLDVELVLVDPDDRDALAAALDERTRLVFCESISNPLTTVTDLPAVAELVRRRSPRGLLAVDATLASPCGQRPLDLGADVVLHSATKYIGGHGDLVAGVLAGPRALLHECWRWRTEAGGSPDPAAAWLVERGLKTLAVRMRAHAENATALARFLAGHPRVERVHFCGLEGDPHHERARRLLRSPGGLLSFVVRGGDEAALAVLRRLEVFHEAASLGGVESLASRPVDLSHADLDEAARHAAGIAPGLLRLAAGIEDAADLVADLERALAG